MSVFDGTRIDHLNLCVSDVETSRRFYTAALGAMGIEELTVIEAGENSNAGTWVGYGNAPNPFFWIRDDGQVGTNTHLAFNARNKEEVHAFYVAAIANGGRDNGKPGPRPEYSKGYYGAFVLDPSGINVEAVYHGEE